MSADRLRDMKILEEPRRRGDRALGGLGRERTLAEGEFLFREGERAVAFHLVLEGQLETTREVAGEQVLMISHGPGGFLGAMALLTDTPYRGTTQARADTVLFELDGEELRRAAFAHPALLRSFLPAIESVSGAIKGVERDREKLLAVGKLAAGLAHELNNPAAAAARGVATLRELRAPAPGGLRRDRRHRRPGRAARRARLPRRPGDRAERAGRAARPAGRERPRAGAGRRARAAGHRRRVRHRAGADRGAARARVGRPGRRRAAASSASPPACASSAPARAPAWCSPSWSRRPPGSPTWSARCAATPTSTRRPARPWTCTRASRAPWSSWPTSSAASTSTSSASSIRSCRASRRRAPSSTRSGRT